MAWRREVYLEAAEAISRLGSVIGSMPDLRVSDKELSSAHQQNFAKISKIQTIGTDDTVEAVNAYLAKVAFLYLPLAIARGQLIGIHTESETLEVGRQKSSEMAERCRALLVQIDASPSSDPKLRLEVAAALAGHQAVCKYAEKRRSELGDEIARAQCALYRESQAAGLEMGRAATPLLIAARRELEIPLDIPRYLNKLDELTAQLRCNIEETATRVEQIVSKEKSKYETA